jgi:hypothetical protein
VVNKSEDGVHKSSSYLVGSGARDRRQKRSPCLRVSVVNSFDRVGERDDTIIA